jgi:hypothetical protein
MMPSCWKTLNRIKWRSLVPVVLCFVVSGVMFWCQWRYVLVPVALCFRCICRWLFNDIVSKRHHWQWDGDIEIVGEGEGVGNSYCIHMQGRRSSPEIPRIFGPPSPTPKPISSADKWESLAFEQNFYFLVPPNDEFWNRQPHTTELTCSVLISSYPETCNIRLFWGTNGDCILLDARFIKVLNEIRYKWKETYNFRAQTIPF